MVLLSLSLARRTKNIELVCVCVCVGEKEGKFTGQKSNKVCVRAGKRGCEGVHFCKCGKDAKNFVRGFHFKGTAADGGCWCTKQPGTDLPHEADNTKMLLTVLNTFVLTFICTVAFCFPSPCVQQQQFAVIF